jgi:Flp pilus assembly protein TadB
MTISDGFHVWLGAILAKFVVAGAVIGVLFIGCAVYVAFLLVQGWWERRAKRRTK